MATKKKTAKKAEKAKRHDGIEILGVSKAVDLRTKNSVDRPTKYEDLWKAALRLKPGDVLELAPKPGEDLDKARERISRAMKRGAQKWTDYYFKMCITENDTIGIYCFENKPKRNLKQAKTRPKRLQRE